MTELLHKSEQRREEDRRDYRDLLKRAEDKQEQNDARLEKQQNLEDKRRDKALDLQREIHKQAVSQTKQRYMPKLAKFDNPNDLELNIGSLEAQLTLYEIPAKFWISHLIPLLDSDSLHHHENMPAHQRNCFASVKKALLEHHGLHGNHYRSMWKVIQTKDEPTYHKLALKIRKIGTAWTNLEDAS